MIKRKSQTKSKRQIVTIIGIVLFLLLMIFGLLQSDSPKYYEDQNGSVETEQVQDQTEEESTAHNTEISSESAQPQDQSDTRPTQPQAHTTPTNLAEARVSRVIDGDTIELTNGERVRLIGVDAPERNQVGGDAATNFTSQKVTNRPIWLEPDGNDRDNHGRLRRYVWINLPTDPADESQIRNYQLNALLLSNGHAEVMIVGSPRNANLFRRIASGN